MTDLEISKALALAIGWNEDLFRTVGGVLFIRGEWGYKRFDYRDWNVIGPIAEKFDAFPYQDIVHGKGAWVSHQQYANTPQKAIARAVIGAQK